VFAPDNWSSALINGDYSGLSDAEEAEVNQFVETIGRDGWYVVSTKGGVIIPNDLRKPPMRKYIVHRH